MVIATAMTVAAGCSTNPGARPGDPAQPAQGFSITFAKDSPAPAPEVPGAARGGTITVLNPSDFPSLDPARAAFAGGGDAQAFELLFRGLTFERTTAEGGIEIMGDLATSAGESSDGDRKWTYTLREGIRFADGTPITSRDIAYGIARRFAPELAQGGTAVLLEWLAGSVDYNKDYKGPYSGGGDVPPGIEVPDDRTIVFTFDQPRPYLPYLVSKGAVPVPKAKDTRERYTDAPVGVGPYQIDRYVRDKELVLKRNPHWDAGTDPVRHQYADGFRFEFGPTPAQITERLLADQGPDQTATTWFSATPELIPEVERDAGAQNRLTKGTTGNVQYMYINTRRVTDLDVRRALNYAMDREAFVKAQGGPAFSEPGTTILSPLIPGRVAYNAYDGGPTGDPVKAKELLAGKTPELTLASTNTAVSQRRALVAKTALERAGFKITLQPVDIQSFYTEVTKLSSEYDLVLGGANALWPDGSLTIKSAFDGRSLSEEGGGVNLSLFNDADVNARIDQLLAETDPEKLRTAWAELDRQIMEQHAPVVPLAYIRSYTLSGSRVGGVFFGRGLNLPSLINAHVK